MSKQKIENVSAVPKAISSSVVSETQVNASSLPAAISTPVKFQPRRRLQIRLSRIVLPTEADPSPNQSSSETKLPESPRENIIEIIRNNKVCFKCGLCDFTRKSRLCFAKHLKDHTEKPFKCNFCEHRFVNKNLMNKHTHIKHVLSM